MNSTRWLLMRNSSGLLSVLPMKWVPGIVPELPMGRQALFKAAAGMVPLVICEPFKFANPLPLPMNEPAKLPPMKLSPRNEP